MLLIWCHTLKAEHRLSDSMNKGLRSISGPGKNEVL